MIQYQGTNRHLTILPKPGFKQRLIWSQARRSNPHTAHTAHAMCGWQKHQMILNTTDSEISDENETISLYLGYLCLNKRGRNIGMYGMWMQNVDSLFIQWNVFTVNILKVVVLFWHRLLATRLFQWVLCGVELQRSPQQLIILSGGQQPFMFSGISWLSLASWFIVAGRIPQSCCAVRKGGRA